MAIRKIARMGHPVLRKKARELTKQEILSPQMKILLEDMIDTMNDYGGIGLAAPQIYESVAIAIVDYQENHPRYAKETAGERDEAPDAKADEDSDATHTLPFTIVINPKITVLDETIQTHWEGCLSVPELRGLVSRPKKVQIDYLDLQAKPKTVIVENFLATVFQHELDHLDGIIYTDRVVNEPGKTTLSFTEEYERFVSPKRDDGDESDEDLDEELDENDEELIE